MQKNALLLTETLVLLIVIAILHNLAVYFELYWSIDSLDSVMHFLGGVWASIFTLWLFFFSGFFSPEKRSFLKILSIGILGTIFISTSWEIFELVTGTAVVEWSDYPFDTSLDFVMDFLGGITACLYAYMKLDSHVAYKVPEKRGLVPENLPI
ncbi:MAG TPA: hypothetical protein VJH67_01890 [Candidatus Paceibacterota bacterium]